MAIGRVHRLLWEEAVLCSYLSCEENPCCVAHSVRGQRLKLRRSDGKVNYVGKGCILYLVCQIILPSTIVDAGLLGVLILRPHGAAVRTVERQ